MEWKTQTYIHTATANCYLTKDPKTHDGERTASLKNVPGRTGYLHVEYRNSIPTFHPVPISI
jgi:hypothetical protein